MRTDSIRHLRASHFVSNGMVVRGSGGQVTAGLDIKPYNAFGFGLSGMYTPSYDFYISLSLGVGRGPGFKMCEINYMPQRVR